jgi:hypothetical protein
MINLSNRGWAGSYYMHTPLLNNISKWKIVLIYKWVPLIVLK